VLLPFRSATVTTGSITWRAVTGALNFTVSSGSTLGTANSIPFKVWVVAFDDAGTIRIGVINCLDRSSTLVSIGRNITPGGIATSTAEGGAGAADSAQVFYSGTAVTAKAYVILGVLEWDSGLATAGTWSSNPTFRQTYFPSMRLPGDVIHLVRWSDGEVATGTTTLPFDDTIPQSGEGVQFMSTNMTPTSTANVLEIEHGGYYSHSATTDAQGVVALFQDATANALAAMTFGRQSGTANLGGFVRLQHTMLAGTTSTTTFKIRAGYNTAGTITFNGTGGARRLGGVEASFISCREIMA
jgi:hypothetical protein